MADVSPLQHLGAGCVPAMQQMAAWDPREEHLQSRIFHCFEHPEIWDPAVTLESKVSSSVDFLTSLTT